MGHFFACIFQFSTIVYFIGTNFYSAYRWRERATVLRLNSINLVLLFLFPLWMRYYTSGVINNSDGADLTVYLHAGWLFYVVLVVLQAGTWLELRRKTVRKPM